MNIQDIYRLILALVLSASFSAYAKDTASLYTKDGVSIVSIELEQGDKIYWHHSGKVSLPSKVELSNISNLKNYIIDWPFPSITITESVINATYTSNVKIPIYVEPEINDKPVNFTVNLSYLLCNKDGCTPKKYSFASSIENPKPIDPKANWKKYDSFWRGGNLVIYLKATDNNIIDFIGTDSNNMVYAPSYIEHSENEHRVFFEKESLKNAKDFTLYNSANYEDIKPKLLEIRYEEEDSSLLIYIAFAIIGGFILNLMPCVLPVLSLKLYSLVNAKSPTERRLEAIISSLTIGLYFLLLSYFTIAAKSVGKVFIIGFTMQNPSIIMLCLIVVTIMISSMREKIVFRMPDVFSTLDSKNKYVGSFLSSLAAVILATPCTAPFLATSMTFALTQESHVIVLIFLSAGFGFAIPYIALIFSASFLKILPKSGEWQNKLKTFFSWILILTIAWLIWLLNSLLGFYSALTALLLIYVLRFCVEYDSKPLIKILSLAFAIVLMSTVPFIVSKDFKSLDAYYERSWEKFDQTKLDDLIKSNEIVFVTVTADWCVTCQFNKIFVIDSIATIELLKQHNVHPIIADLTKDNAEISSFLSKNNVSGIPFNIIYGPKNTQGIVLPVLFTYNDLEKAILEVK